MVDNRRQFTDAAREAAKNPKDVDGQESLVFVVGDHEIEVEYPGSGQLTYLATITASDEQDIQRWGAIINFLVALMSDEDGRIVKRALLANELELDEIANFVEEVMEAWGSRPTTRPSGSSPQRQATGRPSTGGARKRASTRSPSRSADS